MIKNVLAAIGFGFAGYVLFQTYQLKQASRDINDGAETGYIDAAYSVVSGGFLQVSNFSDNNMGASLSLIGYLKGFEKYIATPYYATAYEKALDKLTIGYGHVILPTENLTYLTEAEANLLFVQDLTKFESYVNKYVKNPLTQNQFDALVSFAFNCGKGAIIKVANRINSGDYEGVPAHIKRYIFQGKNVVNGLVNRRNKDVAIWTNGTYLSWKHLT